MTDVSNNDFNPDSWVEYLSAGLCTTLLLGAFFWALNHTMSMPDVHFSYATNECVEVVNYKEGDQYTCENYPAKFNHVWVE